MDLQFAIVELDNFLVRIAGLAQIPDDDFREYLTDVKASVERAKLRLIRRQQIENEEREQAIKDAARRVT